MNLDEEAERLLRLHPAVRAGVQPEYRDTHWLPQHAVPRRPKVEWPKPDDAWIDRQVAADLANIDAEQDPEAQRFMHRTYGKYVRGPGGPMLLENYFALMQQRLTDLVGQQWHLHFTGLSFDDIIKGDITELPRRPPKQPKPKTYVAPGRKAGKTWIARLEQSKQARAKR